MFRGRFSCDEFGSGAAAARGEGIPDILVNSFFFNNFLIEYDCFIKLENHNFDSETGIQPEGFV